MRRAALLLALGLAGCAKASDEAPAKVWALGAIREAARSHEVLGEDVPADGLVAFRGQPIPFRAAPYPQGPAFQAPDVDGAPVFPSFCEGQPAAYLTTDVWYDRAPVWVQPLYIAVTAWDAASPFSKRLAGALPVFAPGAESSFYSPYWQVKFAVVAADTDPGALKTAKDVLDRASELHDGPKKLCSLTPLDMAPAAPAGDVPRRPLTGEPVGRVRVGQGWADGKLTGFFDYGNDRFTASEDGEVVEAPIFHFVAPDPAGELKPIGLPSVAGVGPLFSGAAPDAPNGIPRFGGLWRLVKVQLPATAAVFLPPGFEGLRPQLEASGAISAPVPDPAAAVDPRAPAYALRVALDARCFAGDGGFPDGCTWLDSQAALEQHLPSTAFTSTDTTLTCPLIEYLGQPVKN